MTPPKIVSIVGQAGAGKDTFADFFVAAGYTKIALADPLKVVCKTLFNIPEDQLWGPSENKTAFSRFAMQVLGTDAVRKINPNTWIELLDQRQRAFFAGKPDPFHIYTTTIHPKGLVVSDTRFLNEATFLKEEMGALQIKINRELPSKDFRKHVSETEVNEIPDRLFNYTLYNTEPLEMFEAMFDLIAEAEGVIDYKTCIAR